MTTTSPGRTVGRPSSWRAAQNRTGALFAIPFYVGFVVVFLLPILYAVYQSLFTVRSGGGLGINTTSTTVFVGLANYVKAFADGSFWAAMVRVACFAVVLIPISLTLVLLAALLLDAARERATRAYRILLLVPYMIPAIVATLIWVYLYSPNVGPFTKIGNVIGINVNFFSSGMLWVSIGNLIIGSSLGFNMLIVYGSLRGVDRSILEAARVDGAGAVRTAWSIKIPSVRGSLVLTGLMSIIGLLQIFNEPLLFRSVSPQTVTKDFTPIMAIYSQAFTNNNYSYAAALSIVLAVVIGILSFLFYNLANRSA